MILICLLAE